KRGVSVSLLMVRDSVLADGQYAALVIFGQDNADDLMGSELIANGPPGGVHAGLQEAVLDGGQQMVSQHAKKNVGLGAVLQMMKNRPLHQRTLDVAEGIFHPRQQDISAPDFLCGQILPIRFENIATVEFLSRRLLIANYVPPVILLD